MSYSRSHIRRNTNNRRNRNNITRRMCNKSGSYKYLNARLDLISQNLDHFVNTLDIDNEPGVDEMINILRDGIENIIREFNKKKRIPDRCRMRLRKKIIDFTTKLDEIILKYHRPLNLNELNNRLRERMN